MSRKAIPSPSAEGLGLQAWLGQLDYPLARLERLSGDVSPRKYFRATATAERANKWEATAIAVVYPEQALEMMSRFEATTALLEELSIRVPRILRRQAEQGLMLLEDFGGETLFDLRLDRAAHLKMRLLTAARLPARIQRLATRTVEVVNPPLDETLFRRELDQTWEVFLEPLKRIDSSHGVGRELAVLLNDICGELSAAPRVACHRDLMARNLMPLPKGELGVLDHQDLRLGPRCYDLASLLNDSIDLTPEEIRSILDVVLKPGDRDLYLRCVVQRCFKIAGTFHRFAQRGEGRYLPLVPKTMARALSALEELLPGEARFLAGLSAELGRTV